jgi:hypothetical protein
LESEFDIVEKVYLDRIGAYLVMEIYLKIENEGNYRWRRLSIIGR